MCKNVIIPLFLRQKVTKIFCILSKSSNFAPETWQNDIESEFLIRIRVINNRKRKEKIYVWNRIYLQYSGADS